MITQVSAFLIIAPYF